MAVYETTRARPASGFAGRLGHTITNLVATVIAWNDARKTRNSLNALSDRELDDIGLCRADINAVARR